MELKGKTLSHVSKILAVVIVTACLLIDALSKIYIPMGDAIKVATFIALVFSPIDISMWLGIFTGKSCHQDMASDEGKGN